MLTEANPQRRSSLAARLAGGETARDYTARPDSSIHTQAPRKLSFGCD